jgi:hypothetical protein
MISKSINSSYNSTSQRGLKPSGCESNLIQFLGLNISLHLQQLRCGFAIITYLIGFRLVSIEVLSS